MKLILDSRDRLEDSEHDFDSENTSSDFVVQLPSKISQFKLLECEIPLTYYVFNDNTNKIIVRPDPVSGAPREYYLVTIPIGTYSSATITTAFQNALLNAVPLANALELPLSTYYAGLTVTFDNDAKKINIDTGSPVGIQFISTASTTDPNGIPFGDPDGFPSELTSTTPDPLREQLSNSARLLGIPANSALPNPFITTDGFALGVQYGFATGGVNEIPGIINLAGDNYIYIRTDVVGITQIRQGSKIEIDTNLSDLTTIQSLILDRGIIEKVQIGQIPFTKLSLQFTNPQTVFLDEATDLINIRLSFYNNVSIDLNGVETSFTIDATPSFT